MKTVDGQRGRLARLAPQLEGCLVVETTSAQAIHIPAASLHATFTLQGGFLVARDFTTSRSLMAISTLLSNGLDENLPLEARTVLFEWFERCLDISITHRKITEAVSAWLRAETKLASWASSQRGWRVSVRCMWEQASLEVMDICPCGEQLPQASFTNHFASAHLSFILSSTQLRRHCRQLIL